MMAQDSCHSLRDALVAFFNTQVEVTAAANQCVVTLPIKTLDDRLVDVWVEPKLSNFVLVHDGGKSMSELFAQGVHLTNTQEAYMVGIARRHGAAFEHGAFRITCTSEGINDAVFAIGQCAVLAMMPLLGHLPVYEDEPLTARVGRTIREWKPEYIDLRKKVKARGRHAAHTFDWVSFPRLSGYSTVAVKVLPPGYGPLVQARQYGFLALDLEDREPDRWARLAIIAKAEEWPPSAIEMVRDLSADVIEVESGDEARVERVLPRKMTELTEAA